MIDDGKHDPPEVKIENTPGAQAHIMAWELELRTSTPKRRKRLSNRLWGLIEAIGNTYAHGGF